MDYPDYYLPVMPYLILDDAAGFLEFAKAVFDAEEKMIVPGDTDRKIMHGEITIGKAAIMFAGATSQWSQKTSGMFLFVDDVDRVFQKASENKAKILTPPTQQEYGYSAGFEDPFGNQWWITKL